MKMDLQSDLQLNTKDLLSHHDIVMRAPVCDPVYGLPLGDGNTGTLFWLSEDTLHIQINNTDFIDDIREGEEYCPVFDEHITVCRNGGQLNIKFPCPVFETIYQKKYEGRLSLGDATVSIQADTPFANVDVRAFASDMEKVTIITLKADFGEDMPMKSELNRWGSRSLTHGFMVWHDDPTIGLDGTDAVSEEECMCITQKMHGASFCIAVKPISSDLAGMIRKNSHVMEAEFSAGTHTEQVYYITAAVSDTPENAKKKAFNQIKSAVNKGLEVLYLQHTKDWEAFWNKSYISLPEKQDFLENVWYLNLYFANCMMRGEYPYLPWNSIWGFYHDYSPWGTILHWNSQSGTFPLDTANHPELARTYYRFCRNMLPNAERYARNIKKKKGAFFVDLCDLKGRMDLTPHYICVDNCSVGAHMALEMYQNYRYTGDEEFLNDSVIPVMRGAADYYMEELKLGEDGYYHIYGTSGYENPMMIQDDTVSDLAAIRALFSALISLIPEEETVAYRERLENLAPFHTTDFYEGEVENGVFLLGQGRGNKVFTDKLLACGANPRIPENCIDRRYIDDNLLRECAREKSRTVLGNPKHMYFLQPDQELMTIFPGNLIGIKDKGTELYNQAANCIYVHRDRDIGWCRMPIFLARMGMAELLDKKLNMLLSDQVIFPQGFTTDYTANENSSENVQNSVSLDSVFNRRWTKNKIGEQVIVDGKRIDEFPRWSTSPMWNLRIVNFECGPLICTGVNEMLLQSYDGIIRLFPAILPDSQVAFRLAATECRMVEAVFSKGECDVMITCKKGGALRVAAEKVNRPLVFFDVDTNQLIIPKEENGCYVIEAREGQHVSVKTEGTKNLSIEKDYSRNMDVKCFEKAKLGTEKEF